MTDKILESLNEKQKEAVTTTQGYVRVIAGAGSGKTKALVHRYAYLVNNLGISPSSILCATFTNKAAKEMSKRLRGLVNEGRVNDFICTYHGFCVKVLREDIHTLQYPSGFKILDEEDQKNILREVYEEFGIKAKTSIFEQSLTDIHTFKRENDYIGELIVPSGEIIIPVDFPLPLKVILSYIKRQKKEYALDFDDLIFFVTYIFSEHERILDKWQSKLQYIMVDETQDNDSIQWGLAETLSGKYGNLFVVGDPDQAIYEWRGAKPEYLVDFDSRFFPCHTIIMAQNYRSTPNILNVANCIIKHNKIRIDKDLHTQNSVGAKVIHLHAKNEKEESQWICDIIKLKQEQKISLNEIAVLYRATYLSRAIEQSLTQNGIPYVIWGGVRFFEREEIKDAISYLRLIDDDDDLALLRIINKPSRKIGKTYRNNIKAEAERANKSIFQMLKENETLPNKRGAQNFITLIEDCRAKKNELTISDLLVYVLNNSGFTQNLRDDGDSERLENIKELIASVKNYEIDNKDEEDLSLTKYLQDIALYTNLDYKGEEKDLVKLMTIHQVKGLEFDVVFVCGLSEGIMPNFRSIRERKTRGMEEERRLMYVAVTRAKKELFLTDSEGFNGQMQSNKIPSRFISEINADLYERQGEITNEMERQAQIEYQIINESWLSDNKTLKINEKIIHPHFGEGTVININEESYEYIIQFNNQEHPSHINMDYKEMKPIHEQSDIDSLW